MRMSRINRLNLAKSQLHDKRRGSVQHHESLFSNRELDDYITPDDHRLGRASNSQMNRPTLSRVDRSRNSVADPHATSDLRELVSSARQSDLLSVNNFNMNSPMLNRQLRSTEGSLSPNMRAGGAVSVMSFNSGKSSNNPAAEKAARAKAAHKADEERERKMKKLNRFRSWIKEPVHVSTPVDLIELPKYKRLRQAKIIKQDHDRTPILDFLIANLFKVLLLMEDRQWQEAFLVMYGNLTVCEMMNEFIIVIRHALVLSILLQKMEINDKALEMLEYLRDIVEDTNNNAEAITVYKEIGKMY